MVGWRVKGKETIGENESRGGRDATGDMEDTKRGQTRAGCEDRRRGIVEKRARTNKHTLHFECCRRRLRNEQGS